MDPAIGFFIAGGVNLLLGLVFIGLGLFIPSLGIMAAAGALEAVIGGVLIFFGLRRRQSAARDRAIALTGLQGTATVLESHQTGVYVNYQPQVTLKVRVSIPGRPDYEVEHKEVFSYMDAGRKIVTEGTQLNVMVDPDNPHRLVIKWDSVS